MNIKPSPFDGVADPWLLSAAFEQSAEGFALVTTDGQVILANPAMTRLAAGKVTGWQAFPAMIRDRVLQLSATGAEPDQPWETVCGTDRKVRWTVTRADGHGWLIRGMDVTDLSAMREAWSLEVERLEAIAALHRLVEHIEFDVDIDTAVELIAERARVMVKAWLIGVAKIDGPDLVYTIFAGAPDLVGIRTPFNRSLSGVCMATGETQITHDSELDPRVDKQATRIVGTRSMVIVPLRHRGEVTGLMNVFSPETSAFTDSDVKTLELIAGAVSVVRAHAADLAAKRVLLTAVGTRQRLLESLLSVQRAISHRRPLQEVLDTITAGASGLLNDCAVALVLRRTEADPLSVASTFSLVRSENTVAPIRDAAARAMDGNGMVTDDHGQAGILIAAPVHVGGEIGGSLVAQTAVAHGDLAERRELLAAFAQQVSLALTDAQTVQAMREAYRDSITGLPNRALFLERLTEALGNTGTPAPVAVLFVDLDHFKEVNDSLGHTAGDALLAEVAIRIREQLRSTDTVARLGGDEFAVMLPGAETAAAVRLAGRIINAVQEPFRLLGRDVFINASIGATSSRTSHAGAVELLSNADVAMYHVKRTGPGKCAVFEPSMHTAVLDRMELHSDLQQALAFNQLSLQFQPLIEISSATPVGVEALLRWTHPRRGKVSPVDFIPTAEETGLIVEIGRWVLWESARQLVEWHKTMPNLTVNINVSARQIADPGFVTDVSAVLALTGVPPHLLSLELTESVLMNDPDSVLPRLRHLKELGVRLSVDDFGTGYSSLAYLCQFPVDELKIDRAFINGVNTTPTNLAIVRTIIELARALNLQTVAEGIEDRDQLETLRGLGCDIGQGFHLARPLDPEAARMFLSRAPAVA